jgi:hypothetical protein
MNVNKHGKQDDTHHSPTHANVIHASQHHNTTRQHDRRRSTQRNTQRSSSSLCSTASLHHSITLQLTTPGSPLLLLHIELISHTFSLGISLVLLSAIPLPIDCVFTFHCDWRVYLLRAPCTETTRARNTKHATVRYHENTRARFQTPKRNDGLQKTRRAKTELSLRLKRSEGSQNSAFGK